MDGTQAPCSKRHNKGVLQPTGRSYGKAGGEKRVLARLYWIHDTDKFEFCRVLHLSGFSAGDCKAKCRKQFDVIASARRGTVQHLRPGESRHHQQKGQRDCRRPSLAQRLAVSTSTSLPVLNQINSLDQRQPFRCSSFGAVVFGC